MESSLYIGKLLAVLLAFVVMLCSVYFIYPDIIWQAGGWALPSAITGFAVVQYLMIIIRHRRGFYLLPWLIAVAFIYAMVAYAGGMLLLYTYSGSGPGARRVENIPFDLCSFILSALLSYLIYLSLLPFAVFRKSVALKVIPFAGIASLGIAIIITRAKRHPIEYAHIYIGICLLIICIGVVLNIDRIKSLREAFTKSPPLSDAPVAPGEDQT